MTENDGTNEPASEPNMGTPPQSSNGVIDLGSQEIHNETASDGARGYLVVDLTTPSNDRTPLYKFLETQTDNNYDAKALSKLLDNNKRDINTPCKSDYKRTPLHTAVWRNLMDAVEKLIIAGALVSVEDEDGRHPLHYACLQEKPQLVRRLLKAGADFEAKDYKQHTPLITASLQWEEEVIRLLVDAGADTTAVDNRKSTALYYSCEYGEMSFARIILEKSQDSINIENDAGWTPLHVAIGGEYEKVVSYLLEKKADINKTDNNGFTPLMLACDHGSEDNVDILLEHDAKWSLLSSRGWTALMYACEGGYTNIAQKLIGLEMPEGDELTSLHIASKQGYAHLVDALIDIGAPIDSASKKQKTALHYASEADGWWRDTYDTESKEFDLEDIPHVPDQYCMVLEILVRKNANLTAKTADGDTALHLAVKRDIRRVRIIMKEMQGKSYNYQNNDGNTALSVAIAEYEPDIVRLLLGKMECADLGKYDEQDAIVWAAESEDRHDIAGTMFGKSANPSSKKWTKGLDPISLVEWATYREMPKVLWFVLSTSSPSPNSENCRLKALKYADDQVSKTVKTKVGSPQKGERPKARDKKAEGRKKEERREQEETQMQQGANIALIRDILRDPPFTQTSRRREPFRKPGVEGALAATTQDFEAAIIEFYEGETESGFLRRFRRVKDVIYDKGPGAISREVKANLARLIGYSKPLEKKWALHEMYARDDPKLTWIHLPATNMVWMNDLLKRIMWDESQKAQKSEEKEKIENEFNEMASFFRDSWLQVPDRESPSRYMKPQCASHGAKKYKAIYMPYLTFSRKVRANASEDDKEAKDLLDAKKRHRELLDTYKGRVVHGTPTLDESYYHFAKDGRSQADRRDRNKTQVVTKILQPYEENSPFWTLLRVNQLWVWVINNHLLITATTHPVDRMEGSLLSDIFGYLGKKTEAGESRAQPSTALDLSKMLVDHCIEFYEREQVQAIKETKLYEMFSKQQNKAKDGIKKRLHNISTDKEDEKRAEENMDMAISEAADLSCDIKDIRDELNILKTIANHQKTVQISLNNLSTSNDNPKIAVSWPRRSGITRRKRADFRNRRRDWFIWSSSRSTAIDRYNASIKAPVPTETHYSASHVVEDIIAMDKAADRIHSAVDTILALEQNDTANAQAEEGIRQGRTLMTFTVITIVFLPLSFLSSLFALDYEASQKTPSRVYGIIIGVAFGVSVALATFALQFSFQQGNKPTERPEKVKNARKASGETYRQTENRELKGPDLV
ncbi:hypothetical protein ABKA04_003530 [Annulohypoxylon sp. FPYF3050]